MEEQAVQIEVLIRSSESFDATSNLNVQYIEIMADAEEKAKAEKMAAARKRVCYSVDWVPSSTPTQAAELTACRLSN